MKELNLHTKNRVRLLYIVLTSVFIIFIIRVGYMQLIYQNNIVTFAQMDQNVKELNAPIIEEVKASFDVNLDNYNEVSTEDIINSGKTDVGSLSLLDIVYTSCQDGCYGRPAVYLQKSKGFVFYKNKDGEDTLAEIQREHSRWAISKINKAGSE